MLLISRHYKLLEYIIFPLAVTSWFPSKKLSHAAHLYANRYSLFVNCRLYSYRVRETFLVFQWKEETFLVKESISNGSVIKRLWHNLEVKKAINLSSQKLCICFKNSCWAILDYDCLWLGWWQPGNTKCNTGWAALKNPIFNIWSASIILTAVAA